MGQSLDAEGGSKSDLRHSYLDTDENLLSADFEYDQKVRLDSRMQHLTTIDCDAESTRDYEIIAKEVKKSCNTEKRPFEYFAIIFRISFHSCLFGMKKQ